MAIIKHEYAAVMTLEARSRVQNRRLKRADIGSDDVSEHNGNNGSKQRATRSAQNV